MELAKISSAYLRTGDTLLYEKPTLLGRSIQILTRSKFNHAGMVRRISGDFEPNIYEAISPVFVMRGIKQSCEEAKRVVVKRPKFVVDEGIFIECNEKLVGKKYFYGGIWHQIGHQLLGGWSGSRDPMKPYCSKSCAWVYSKMTDDFKDFYKTSPDDLFENLVDFDTFELDH